MRRIWLVGVAALALCACATKYPGEPASAHDAERADDAFALQIEAGRLEVFDNRIQEALDLLPAASPPAGAESAENAEAELLRHAAASVRTAWLGLLDLKTKACMDGKLTAQSCAGLAPPAWLAEPPNAPVEAIELRHRIDDLQEAMDPMLQAACETGRKLSKEENPEMFCSVE